MLSPTMANMYIPYPLVNALSDCYFHPTPLSTDDEDDLPCRFGTMVAGTPKIMKRMRPPKDAGRAMSKMHRVARTQNKRWKKNNLQNHKRVRTRTVSLYLKSSLQGTGNLTELKKLASNMSIRIPLSIIQSAGP